MGGAWEPDEGASSVENEREGLWWGSKIEVNGVSTVGFGVNLGFEKRGFGFVVFKVVGSGDGSGNRDLEGVRGVMVGEYGREREVYGVGVGCG